MLHLDCNVRNKKVGFANCGKKVREKIHKVSEQVLHFSSKVGRLHFQLLQICPALKMQTCFHM